MPSCLSCKRPDTVEDLEVIASSGNMRRNFLTSVLLAAALLSAPAYSAGAPPAIGVIDNATSLRPPMLVTPVTAATKIAFRQNGRASSPKKVHSDRKILYWVIGITAGAALAIGLTAAAQGKSPF